MVGSNPDEKDKGPDSEYARAMWESSEGPEASWKHKGLALFSSNMLLAGFLVLPGLFLKSQKSQEAQHIIPGQILSHAIQNKLLLIVACSTFATGVGIIGWLWWVNRQRYYWLYNELFL
jgi:hypothetical protein